MSGHQQVLSCGGYSFYKDAKLLRLTRYRYNNVPSDSNGRYYYIKDGSTVWNPGWQPTQTELDSYSCRHGLGYSVIRGEKNSLSAEVTAFVPLGYSCEVNKLVLKNTGNEPKSFSLYSYVEFCFWNAMDDMSPSITTATRMNGSSPRPSPSWSSSNG